MVTFGLIITFALIIAGFIFKSNKSIAIIQNIWLWIVIGFTNGGADFDANVAVYHSYANASSSNSVFEWIARPLGGLLQNKFGWVYWQYNALIVGIVLLIFLIVAWNNTENTAVFYSMFMIYPFIDSVIQKRFFYAFVLSALSILCQSKKQYKTSIFLIIMALGFHFSAILIIPYLFMDYILKNHPRFIWIVLILEIYVLTFQRGVLNIILNSSSSKVDTYVTGNISVKAGILYIIVQLSFVSLTVLIENKDLLFNNIWLNARENFVMRINIFSLIFLPLLMMDSTFFRYYRIIMLVSYMSISNRLKGSFLINDIRYYFACIYILLLGVFQIASITFGDVSWEIFLDTMFK